MASAPDLISQLNATNANVGNATALLNKMLACSNAKQFYNSATGGCSGGPAAITRTYVSLVYNVTRNPQTDRLGSATCASSILKKA